MTLILKLDLDKTHRQTHRETDTQTDTQRDTHTDRQTRPKTLPTRIRGGKNCMKMNNWMGEHASPTPSIGSANGTVPDN